MAEGRGGVVKNSWTTPPRLHDLMRLRDFVLIVQPPLLLLRRGARIAMISKLAVLVVLLLAAGRPPIIDAVRKGDTDALRSLMRRGPTSMKPRPMVPPLCTGPPTGTTFRPPTSYSRPEPK